MLGSPVMRLLSMSALMLLLACASAPPPAAPAPAPPPPAKPASAPPAPPPKPEPPAPKSQKPTVPDFEVLVRSGMPAAFAEVEKNFKEKYFEQALQALETQKTASKRGQLAHDHKMLMYAAIGFASAMQNSALEAKGAYRRVLPMWANWRKESKAIMALEKDAAAGQKRVDNAVDAVGEALFFLAEEQRAKADEIAMPAYDGDSDPKNVNKHLSGKVKQWNNRRVQKVKKAATEYERVLKLEPKPPPRLVAAAASRIGAMHALMLEELRTITAPSDWKKEGKSEYVDRAKGKEPLDWAVVHADFEKLLAERVDPVKQAATDAYRACVQASAQHGVSKDDVFLKSCKDWLDANP